nr:hypothetical protein [Tabrizicola sp. TH137]
MHRIAQPDQELRRQRFVQPEFLTQGRDLRGVEGQIAAMRQQDRARRIAATGHRDQKGEKRDGQHHQDQHRQSLKGDFPHGSTSGSGQSGHGGCSVHGKGK